MPATAESASTRGYEVSAWTGVCAPPSIGTALRDKLAADIAEALRAPDVVERYKTMGYEAPALDAVAFAELVKRETESWGEIIRGSGLRLD